MRVLHIIASPREHNSNTLRIANSFLETLRATAGNVTVDVVDLYNHDLPAIAGTNIDVKYTLMIGQPIDKNHAESWHQIERLIEHFVAADMYVISCPMWNFSIPYALKYYIDCIVQPGYVFKYDQDGRPVPLVLGKKMVCITSRGGDYGPTGPLHAYDFQEPYLRAIFGFIGITENHFINAQPMDITPALREAAVEAATLQAQSLAMHTAAVAPV
ncbi:FMN-dependent NADH-azoreductase [Kribbella deserti]|uniref:FMN dependent NADH:quinone oxidoreductase n=1 Tax=Kribbella deserti TaxID=1926257 RepID=A0ABV6QDC1_9ACTN